MLKRMRQMDKDIRAKRVGLLAGTALALVLGGGLVGCGGGMNTQHIDNNTVASSPRPAYGSLNIVMTNASIPATTTASTSGSTTGTTPVSTTLVHQLFLDMGKGNYVNQWPQVVGNDHDNQSSTLWRYDFIETAASVLASGGKTGAGTEWYATILMRVDDTLTDGNVTFWGRGGVFPVNAQALNPLTLFPTNVPETPANKKPAASWIYVRQGNPVSLVDPSVVGEIGPYGAMPTSTQVAINLPGLDFPVGGAGLMPADTTLQTVGITAPFLDIQIAAAAASATSGTTTTSATTTPAATTTGTAPDPITTPAATCVAQRVVPSATSNTGVSPFSSQWDMVFGWQPAAMGVTLTHSVLADSAAGGEYADGSLSATGGGFFLTMNPGSANPAGGVNTLNWTVLRGMSDSVWCLGWSADMTGLTNIQLGQSSDVFSNKLPGAALVAAQVRGYLSGLMTPGAGMTVFQGAQDKNFIAGGNALLIEGSSIPMLGRLPNAQIPGHFAQMVIGGRSIWAVKNGVPTGADVPNSDQSLADPYGTVMNFSAYLPVPAK